MTKRTRTEPLMTKRLQQIPQDGKRSVTNKTRSQRKPGLRIQNKEDS